MSDLAPVVLFVYNRPEHTRQTLAALAANPLASESDLIIYADGPKTPEHAATVSATRAIARAATGFRSVSLVEQRENLGLARSIVSGVTETCDSHGRVIVLEDDLVVAPGFLSYMNQALDRYANDDRVMQISGYMFPILNPDGLPDAFFSTLSTTWGWATWRRAWKNLELDAGILLDKLQQSNEGLFNRGGLYPFLTTLKGQRGRFDVWGIRWYASMFVNGGVCLHPVHSLVRNIGMDGSGENCGPSSGYDTSIGDFEIRTLPHLIAPHAAGDAKIDEFFRKMRGSVLNRVTVGAKEYAARALKALRA